MNFGTRSFWAAALCFSLVACGGGGGAEDSTLGGNSSGPLTPPNQQPTASLQGDKMGYIEFSTLKASVLESGNARQTTITTTNEGLNVAVTKISTPTPNGPLNSLSVTFTSVKPLGGAIPADLVTSSGQCYLPRTDALPFGFILCSEIGITLDEVASVISFSKVLFRGITGDLGDFLVNGTLSLN